MANSKKYQAFYTKSAPIVNYMIDKLVVNNDDKILDPCAGDGVFIDAILARNIFTNVDAREMNETSAEILKEKYLFAPTIHVQQCDTLIDDGLTRKSTAGGFYDKIIANPPYGAWHDDVKRSLLKKIYPNVYVKESYTLFLYRCIDLLKNGGRLCFIIPDTFLNLHMHKAIRNHILTQTKIVELLLFPSSFFPQVNFGYANLSIITLEKCNNKATCLHNNFNIVSGFKNVNQLSAIHNSKLRIQTHRQTDIYANIDHAFLLSENKKVVEAIKCSQLTIGDIANCVTGFYSGNDKQFLQVDNYGLRNAKRYDLVNPDTINHNYLGDPNLLNGIHGTQYFIPIVKGGNTKFLKPDGWFINWSKYAVNHYRTNKKSRLQNTQYYFKTGIGIPMISSLSITASLIENKLFDQSIVGVFPTDARLTYYLLGFFNTPTCNVLIRTINPSANNSANYIKKIPFIMPSSELLNTVNKLVAEITGSLKTIGSYNVELENEINKCVYNLYGF